MSLGDVFATRYRVAIVAERRKPPMAPRYRFIEVEKPDRDLPMTPKVRAIYERMGTPSWPHFKPADFDHLDEADVRSLFAAKMRGEIAMKGDRFSRWPALWNRLVR